MKKNIDINKKYSLWVDGYTKKFKNFVAVNKATFGVSHGKIHGFIGPNGAGKTTTIKAVIGAYEKTEGEILVEGFKAGTAKAKKRIGYIPERASFPKNMTCMEYLVAMAQLSGFGISKSKTKALEILEDLGLTKHKNRRPYDFSSGMKKKILVAQALMLEPTLLVLDEPAANLDPTARKEMFDMFRKVKEKGCSILLSSHILSELQDIIDEVTFISQGEIRYTGSIEELTKDKGIVVNFVNPKLPAAISVIKKYKLENSTSGWIKKTKTHAETISVIKKIVSENIKITNISFIESNLSFAYDKLVIKHGRESGVNKLNIKERLKLFFKTKNKKTTILEPEKVDVVKNKKPLKNSKPKKPTQKKIVKKGSK